ncbi:MAG: hypothetical protein VB108_05630 [Anaerolineaceae bacterium]|nr:hypothetical protein [Anaerolineaceae bacterium]
MPKIRCHYLDCTYLDDRYCCAAAIELNPDAGCTTYAPNEESEAAAWNEDLDDEWESNENEDENDDLWAPDEEDPEDEGEEDSDEY